MTQREHAEDTTFWSFKSAEQFAARRRTVDLFLGNLLPEAPSHYNWIDNTETVWVELLQVLETQNPSSIAINVDSDIAFSGGLHVGELIELLKKLGNWQEKFVAAPMVGVEFVGTMVWEQLGWYRNLQETTWAMIEEGFSEKIITPGKTSTEV